MWRFCPCAVAAANRDCREGGAALGLPGPEPNAWVCESRYHQANIEETICNPNWSTKNIRPPESYNSKLKTEQMRQWSLPGTAADYQEDHLISSNWEAARPILETYGQKRIPPSQVPERKTLLRTIFTNRSARGALTLEAAQHAIATDWYKVYTEIHR
jgi:hypothetical protein